MFHVVLLMSLAVETLFCNIIETFIMGIIFVSDITVSKGFCCI